MRAFLTMLGIIIGISSVITITSVGSSVQSSMNGFLSSFGKNRLFVYVNFDENENQIDPEKIQAHEYHIRIPRQLYKKFDAMVLSGAMDFANLDVEDIAYQEVQETQNTEENEWEDDE